MLRSPLLLLLLRPPHETEREREMWSKESFSSSSLLLRHQIPFGGKEETEMKMEGVQVPPSRTVRPHTGRFRNYVPIIHRGPDFFLSKPHPVVRSQPTIGVGVRIPPSPLLHGLEPTSDLRERNISLRVACERGGRRPTVGGGGGF